MPAIEYSAEHTARLRGEVSLSHLLECGDVARWWCTHIAQCMPTAVISSPHTANSFSLKENEPLRAVTAETDIGHLPLAEFATHPDSGLRGLVIIHGGTIIAETYPGLRPEDSHLWASCAKPMAGLMIEMLIDGGRISDTDTVGMHLPVLRNTDWAEIAIRDMMDMTPGMDCEENNTTRADPRSTAIRAFLAEFGEPFDGQLETLLNVLRSSRRVGPAGQKFEYGSPCTQTLVLLAEAVSGLPWSDLFAQNVWSQMRADGPLQMHLSPDGIALAHGITSSRLRDMARFGMLYTPSCLKIATQQVVSPATLRRIQTGTRDRAFFLNGYDGPVFIDLLGDDTMLGNARQWDCIWPDGDLFKGGFMGQGLYVSPAKDTVIAYFSTTPHSQMARYLRPIMTSGLLS